MRLLSAEELKVFRVRVFDAKHKLNSIGHGFQDCLPKKALKHLEKSIDSFYKFLDEVGLKDD